METLIIGHPGRNQHAIRNALPASRELPNTSTFPYRAPFVAVFAVLGVVLLAGCSGTRGPVLYPNEHLETVGESAARQDVDDCMRRARELGAASGSGGAIARDTFGGAAIGAASAGAWAAVVGRDVGERVAAGAAAGGAAGLVRGALRSGEPSAVHKNFVRRCLRERGYDVIGWN